MLDPKFQLPGKAIVKRDKPRPRTSMVDRHPKLRNIEEDLMSGKYEIRTIARTYFPGENIKVVSDVLSKHRDSLRTKLVDRADPTSPVAQHQRNKYVGMVHDLYNRSQEIRDLAVEQGQWQSVPQIMKQTSEDLDRIGQATGLHSQQEINTGVNINIQSILALPTAHKLDDDEDTGVIDVTPEY